MKIIKLLFLTIISFNLCQAAQLDKYKKLLGAVKNGDLPVVQNILEDPSINVDCIDLKENSALMWASYFGHEKIVKLLIDRKANVNEFNKDLITALIWASEKGYLNIVKLLVDKGARINALDKNRASALIRASANGKKEVVKFLLDHDADVNCKDINGETALDHALNYWHQNCVDLLNIYINEYLPYKKNCEIIKDLTKENLSSNNLLPKELINIVLEYDGILKFSEFLEEREKKNIDKKS